MCGRSEGASWSHIGISVDYRGGSEGTSWSHISVSANYCGGGEGRNQRSVSHSGIDCLVEAVACLCLDGKQESRDNHKRELLDMSILHYVTGSSFSTSLHLGFVARAWTTSSGCYTTLDRFWAI